VTALESMVRLHRWTLDEKRRKLAELEGLRNKLRADVDALQRKIEREREAAAGSSDGAVALPAFVAVTLDRCERLEETIKGVEEAILEAREEVQGAFQELKTYEKAQTNQRRRESEKRQKRDQILQDEQAIEQHRRRAAAGS